MSQEPYLKSVQIIEVIKYNPEYGDSRICECGHHYERHFDSYEDMEPVGCKYCSCDEFIEIEEGKDTVDTAAKNGYTDGKSGLPYNNIYSDAVQHKWHYAYHVNYQWGLVAYKENNK